MDDYPLQARLEIAQVEKELRKSPEALRTTRRQEAAQNREIKGIKKEIATQNRQQLAMDKVLTGLLVPEGAPRNPLAMAKKLQQDRLERIAKGIEPTRQQERGLNRDDDRW